jgi:hypothetical protein
MSYEGFIAMRWIPYFFIMKIIDKIRKWFKIEIEEFKPDMLKTIQTLNIFDDVWVLKEKQIHKGWVYEKTKNSIIVIYKELDEIKFHYTRPLSQTIITNGTNKLILNETDINSIQTFENNTDS